MKNQKFNGTLNAAMLAHAAELAQNIENQQAELNALLSGQSVPVGMRINSAVSKGKGRGSRSFSPEVRAKIAAGQKARWAARKAEAAAASKGTTSATTGKSTKTNGKAADTAALPTPAAPKAPSVPASAMA